MTVGYGKFNQVVIPITGVVPDVVSLLKQIYTSPGTWYEAVDLENVLFFILANKTNQKQFSFSWQSQQYTFNIPPQGYITSQVLCHSLVRRSIDHLFLPQISPWSITLLMLF